MKGAAMTMVALLLATLASPMDARANRDEARRMYQAGQKAFVATKYGAAIAAFERAQQLAPNPAVVYSLAQSYRLRFFVNRSQSDLRKADELYRQYLKEAPEGSRRQYAVEHLAAIAPLLKKPADVGGTPAPIPTVPAAPTRMMVQVLNVKDARVILDGGKPVKAPLIDEVKPGRHTIEVEADGYFGVELTRTAAKGDIAVIDVELKPKPGKVTVKMQEGASLFIDGKLHGTGPLKLPVTLPMGSYRFDVIDNGHNAVARTVEVARGGALTMDTELTWTTQRHTAMWLFVGSAVMLANSGLALAIALEQNSQAKQIADRLAAGKALTAEDIEDYNNHLELREALKTASWVGIGIAATGGLIAALMWGLDTPTPGTVPAVALEPGGARVGVSMPFD